MIGLDGWAIYARLLFLIVVANAAPILGRLVMKDRMAFPLDFGWTFLDGQPFLGPSKTVRGCVLAVAASAVCAPVAGLSASTGLVIALAAMFGDSLASFVKRRLGREPGSSSVGLDQVPESLLPMLVLQQTFRLDLAGILGAVMVFALLDVLLSRYLYRRRTPSGPTCCGR